MTNQQQPMSALESPDLYIKYVQATDAARQEEREEAEKHFLEKAWILHTATRQWDIFWNPATGEVYEYDKWKGHFDASNDDLWGLVTGNSFSKIGEGFLWGLFANNEDVDKKFNSIMKDINYRAKEVYEPQMYEINAKYRQPDPLEELKKRVDMIEYGKKYDKLIKQEDGDDDEDEELEKLERDYKLKKVKKDLADLDKPEDRWIERYDKDGNIVEKIKVPKDLKIDDVYFGGKGASSLMPQQPYFGGHAPVPAVYATQPWDGRAMQNPYEKRLEFIEQAVADMKYRGKK